VKKIVAFLAPLFLSALLSAHPEEPTPSVNPDVIWHTITVVDYKELIASSVTSVARKAK